MLPRMARAAPSRGSRSMTRKPTAPAIMNAKNTEAYARSLWLVQKSVSPSVKESSTDANPRPPTVAKVTVAATLMLPIAPPGSQPRERDTLVLVTRLDLGVHDVLLLGAVVLLMLEAWHRTSGLTVAFLTHEAFSRGHFPSVVRPLLSRSSRSMLVSVMMW